MSDRIILTGMRFYGYHGVLPEETKLGQTFLVDAELYTDLQPAGQSDDLDRTVNYALAFDVVKQVVEGQPYKLIEAVAEKTAAELLRQFPLTEVVIRVHKPRAPIAGAFENVTVEVRRRRVS